MARRVFSLARVTRVVVKDCHFGKGCWEIHCKGRQFGMGFWEGHRFGKDY
jgi:hypothetical protein